MARKRTGIHKVSEEVSPHVLCEVTAVLRRNSGDTCTAAQAERQLRLEAASVALSYFLDKS